MITTKANFLEKIFQENKLIKCDFLKIDCEGCEYQLFNGIAPKTLSKIRYLSMEVHFFNKEMEEKYRELKALLINNKFSLREVENPVHRQIKLLYAKNLS